MKTFIFLIFMSIMSTNLFAMFEDGRNSYRKYCMSCHGDGKKGAFMSTQEGWVKLFAKDATELKAKHGKDASVSFFDSDEFKKNSKNMFDFLKEYASDSGNVAGCGDSCE
jgi:hypothetical protein